MKIHIIYKITNSINGKFYIGKHSTNNIEDNYLGSSKILYRAIKKYGKENFTKEILDIFYTEQEALDKESELVNETFVNRKDTYNLTLGGSGSFYAAGKSSKNFVTVKDQNGNTRRVSTSDSRYLSGELVHHTKNTISVKD